MPDQDETKPPKVQAGNNSIAVGNISVGRDISGNVHIGNVGYTVEQVSVLLTQISSTFQPKPFDGRCPYKGLDVFEEEDANLFFGRERLVEDLLGRVKESRTVFITGPSGSGKSSLVRAGLIHALKQGAIKDLHSERWLYETMKPGRDPIKDLALAFSRLKSPDLADYFQTHAGEIDILDKCAESVLSGHKDQRFLLFVDQFEEVFTQVSQEEERLAFINMLTYAGTVENGRVIVLFVMRSDFVSNCATYPMINELLSQQFRQIGAMQPEELVSAIALPAKHVGLLIEDQLIARIINDMKGEPGALPLMQFALKDLFDSQQAQGGVIALTLEDYLRRGGIHKSLERHADHSFEKLSESEQELARSIFGGLIEIGRDTADTGRTALFEELVPVNVKAEDVWAVVQKLADARLIITDEQAGQEIVTLAHEKLIDAWPWLKKLVNENRGAIALQNEIAADAKEWDDHQRDPSYLYTGARLGLAQEQVATQKIILTALAKNFIDEGIKVREAERKTKELSRRRTIMGLVSWIAMLVVGIVIVLVLAGFALFQMREAQQQAKLSRAGELAAQSLALQEKNFPISLLLGVEAFNIVNTVQPRSALLHTVYANPQLQAYLSRHTDWVNGVAFSPDGKTLASGSRDHTIILWDVETRQAIGQPLTGHTDSVYSVAFSPDGKTLASGSWDNTVILWDVATRQAIGQPLQGHTHSVYGVAFSPDGTTLASGSWDNTIILWDVETIQAIGQPLQGHTYWVGPVAFSPDGKTLASGSGDNTIILWDVETRQAIGQPLTGHTSAVYSVAFSPDGKTLASGSLDNTIILWDVETRQAIGQPLQGHRDYVVSVAFSPVGNTLASGSGDNTIILWDVATKQAIWQPLQGHRDYVLSVAFSPDGTTLASGSRDNTVILWGMDPYSWIQKACQRVGRNFTQAEWTQYFPNEEYRVTCPQWPRGP